MTSLPGWACWELFSASARKNFYAMALFISVSGDYEAARVEIYSSIFA